MLPFQTPRVTAWVGTRYISVLATIESNTQNNASVRGHKKIRPVACYITSIKEDIPTYIFELLKPNLATNNFLIQLSLFPRTIQILHHSVSQQMIRIRPDVSRFLCLVYLSIYIILVLMEEINDLLRTLQRAWPGLR